MAAGIIYLYLTGGMMILENIRDKKLIELYQMLTRSDMNGNIKDGWVIKMLYALNCVDSLVSQSGVISSKEYVVFAKEVVRISETEDNDGENLYISLPVWTVGLMEYMKKTGMKMKQIHSMSGYELMMNVKKLINE